MWIILFFVAAAISGLCFWGAKSSSAMKDKMQSMPTTPIEKLSRGYVEIKGICSSEHAMDIPHVEGKCVYYSYVLEEHRRKSNGEGHEWRTIDRGSSHSPFTLTDRTGSVNVVPNDAEHDAPEVYQGYVDAGFSFGDGEGVLGMLGKLANATASRDRRVRVNAIRIDEELYILGNVHKRDDGSVSIRKGKTKEHRFFISTRSEDELVQSYGRKSIAFYVGTGVFGLGALICLIKHLSA